MSQKKLFYWMIAFLAIALFGFADSVYLTAAHYLGGVPTCTIMDGCDEVALSAYSTIGPVPVALLGALFYAAMMVAAVTWFDTRIASLIRYLPFVTIPAFLFSMWLVVAMVYFIQALCIFCLLSAGSTTLLMLISIRMRFLPAG